MDSDPPVSGHAERTPATVVASGVVALAVAMGVGRFAFTPLLPLMMRDGVLTSAAGAGWAAANYAGYLVGALTASRFARDPRRGVIWSLLGICLTTLAMAWAGRDASGSLGAVLRAASGVCSAWALVCASGWCLAELAWRRVPRLGGWIYTGVGLGIALTGALAWLGGGQAADRLWLELGLLSGVGALFVWSCAGGRRFVGAPVVEREAAASAPGARGGHWHLVLCYGAFGFGYIVPATFLPAMARRLTPDPLVFGLAWPVFGLAAALSVAAVARWLADWPRRRVWALAQAVMALGTALPLAAQTVWAIIASAVLVGGTFMVATMAGLQIAREERPDDPTPLLARMTAAFAGGQIVGPLLVRALGTGLWAGWDALGLTGAAATVLLALTAAWLGVGSVRDRGDATVLR